MKIGVIADTHIPHLIPDLPPRLFDVLRGVDIVLHVGDICQLQVLQKLEDELALTFAVFGEEDGPELRRFLEERKVIRFGRRRIGMIHGHQLSREESWLARVCRLLRPLSEEEFYQRLVSRFEGVDCIVFGHTHRPYVKMHKGVLLFNPGALSGPHPSVGLLEATETALRAKVVRL